MDEVRVKLFSSIVIAVSLVICAFILKDAYIKKGYPPVPASAPTVNVDLTKVEEALRLGGKDVLTAAEAAQYLGIKEDDFTTMLYNKKLDSLPYVNIAGRIVFSKKALNDWMEKAAKTHVSIKP